MLDNSGFMVVVPVADFFSVVIFDASDGNRRGDDILGQVFCDTFASWRNVPLLDMPQILPDTLSKLCQYPISTAGKGADGS